MLKREREGIHEFVRPVVQDFVHQQYDVICGKFRETSLPSLFHSSHVQVSIFLFSLSNPLQETLATVPGSRCCCESARGSTAAPGGDSRCHRRSPGASSGFATGHPSRRARTRRRTAHSGSWTFGLGVGWVPIHTTRWYKRLLLTFDSWILSRDTYVASSLRFTKVHWINLGHLLHKYLPQAFKW